jgi:hypothetical protein
MTNQNQDIECFIETQIGKKYPENTFILQQLDGDSTVTVTFTAVFTDELVRKMLEFIRGCGHHDDNIYGAMAQVAEEYFDCKENPVPDLLLHKII